MERIVKTGKKPLRRSALSAILCTVVLYVGNKIRAATLGGVKETNKTRALFGVPGREQSLRIAAWRVV